MALLKKPTSAQALDELQQVIGTIREEHYTTSNTLVDLLAKQKRDETARLSLVERTQEASKGVIEARESLARNIGKASESIHALKLSDAQDMASIANDVLKHHDEHAKREETHARILTLREHLTQIEQERDAMEAKLATAMEAKNNECAVKERAALLLLLSAYDDLLTVFASTTDLQDLYKHDPALWDKLQQELTISYMDLFDWLHSNIGHAPGARPALLARIQTVKNRIASVRNGSAK